MPHPCHRRVRALAERDADLIFVRHGCALRPNHTVKNTTHVCSDPGLGFD